VNDRKMFEHRDCRFSDETLLGIMCKYRAFHNVLHDYKHL
jgi:hypothetical protein